ncbi:MAG: hypothetical protein PHI34_09085, partial [Acidobacteriota bacterium]|nr:hypothetical protein [Acidobacteriota bacterium]
ATAGMAQNLPRFELNLYGGYGLKSIDTGTSFYYNWTGSYYYMDAWGASSNFNATGSGGPGFGGGFAFYFHPNIGIGFNFGYFRTALDTVTNSDMWWSWTYTSGNYYAYPDSGYLDEPMSMAGVSNYFQTIPISLNAILRFGRERFQGYFSFGPTLFLNKISVESELAYMLYYGNWSYFAVDVIRVPTSINESWTSIGADFGAGFTFWVAPAFGIFFDARYYLSGTKTFDWTYSLNEYDGLFENLYYDFTQEDVNWLYDNGLINGIEIKPSFLQISAGIKIRLY